MLTTFIIQNCCRLVTIMTHSCNCRKKLTTSKRDINNDVGTFLWRLELSENHIDAKESSVRVSVIVTYKIVKSFLKVLVENDRWFKNFTLNISSI